MFAEYIETFQVKVHKASTLRPGKASKSVVLHVLAKYIYDAPLKNDVHMRTTNTGEVETTRFVRSCVYLGAVIHESLSDDVEISGRMLKATQMFGMLRKEMLSSKDTWPGVN
jgi:hypothetical protein